MEGNSGYLNGKRLSDYDDDTKYLTDGVEYCIFPLCATTKYVFGIAWIDKVNDNNDNQM